MLKTILEKIGTGLLLGIGIAITMSAISYGLARWQYSDVGHEVYETALEEAFKEYDAEAKLAIKEHRPQSVEANSAFIGQVVNNGKDTWASVEFIVELFQEDGQFIDKCTSYLDGSIAPGETRNFKVSCPNCANNPMPKYDRYTIEITDASFVQASK